MIGQKDSPPKPVQSNRIGPSIDQFVTANLKITSTVQISAYLKSGDFFVIEKTLEPKSVDLLEYGQAKAHNHNMGGDVNMQAYEIVDEFYTDANIENIYVCAEDQDVDLFLVLSEEIDMMSLKLAKLQRRIAKQHPDHAIEIIYTLKDHFTTENLPDGAELYPRRK